MYSPPWVIFLLNLCQIFELNKLQHFIQANIAS